MEERTETDPTVTPPVPATADEPLSIEFRDPDRTIAICGERVALELRIKGTVAASRYAYAWLTLPAGSVGLKISRDGTEADFTTRFPGIYTFAVAVAGSDGSVAQAFKTVELRQDTATTTPAATAAAVSPADLGPRTADSSELRRAANGVEPRRAAPAGGGARPFSTGSPAADDAVLAAPPALRSGELRPEELIVHNTTAVRDPQKQANLERIRAALRETALSIDQGILRVPPGMHDYLGYLLQATRGQAAVALENRYPLWAGWFDELEGVYRQMQAQGAILAPSNVAAAHRSTISVLEGL